MTLETYMTYENDQDIRYELVDGVLVEMPPESDQNNQISLFLLFAFARFVSIRLIRHKDTELVVTGQRTRVRLPDVLILSEEGVAALEGKRATIMPEMPPPRLVVEIVSPGKVNADRDYRYKRSEYAARGIAEYWIVDPLQEKVSILTWVEGLYEEAVFQGETMIQSPTFPDWSLSAEQILVPTRGC